jgi:hypothetical protein
MNDETKTPDDAPESGADEAAVDDAAAPANEEELRQRLEEQLRELRVEDILLQSVASLLNLSARRIAKEDERDLAQAKLGIDSVRAVLPLLTDKDAEAVRGAVSELQMLYARHAGGEPGAPGDEAGSGEDPAEAGGAAAEAKQRADARSKLWTPPGN